MTWGVRGQSAGLEQEFPMAAHGFPGSHNWLEGGEGQVPSNVQTTQCTSKRGLLLVLIWWLSKRHLDGLGVSALLDACFDAYPLKAPNSRPTSKVLWGPQSFPIFGFHIPQRDRVSHSFLE